MNIPGIALIEFIEEKYITIPHISNGDDPVSPILEDGSAWQKFDALQGTVGLTSAEKESKAGIYYQVGVSGFYTGIDNVRRSVLTRLCQRRHVYRLTDVTGQKYIVGTNSFHPRFTYTKVNGPAPTDRRGYSFSISLQSTFDVLFHT